MWMLPSIQLASTTLAVVARDDIGEVVKVWAKTHHLCSTLQAEASTIFWVVQLAKAEGWHQIVIEGNSKDMLGFTQCPSIHPHWEISAIISNILLLLESFRSCLFSWVKRDCNAAAHVVANLSINSV